MMGPQKSAYVRKSERLFWGQFYLVFVVNRVVYTEVITHVLKAVLFPLLPNISHILKFQVELPRANGMHVPPAGSVLHIYRTFLAMQDNLGQLGKKKKKICFWIGIDM